jgi:hypothetical protein
MTQDTVQRRTRQRTRAIWLIVKCWQVATFVLGSTLCWELAGRKKKDPSDLVDGLDMACHYVSLTKLPLLGNRRAALSQLPAVSYRRLRYSGNYRPRTLVAVAAVDKEQVTLKIVYISGKSLLLARSEVSQSCS